MPIIENAIATALTAADEALFWLRAKVAPRATVQDMLVQYRRTGLVVLMARLGIAARLGDGPKTAAELLPARDYKHDSFRRLLRGLVGVGLLEQPDREHYRLTKLGAQLIPARADSLYGAACYGEMCYRAFLGLPAALKSGRPAFKEVFDEEFYEYLSHHDEISGFCNQIQPWPRSAYEMIVSAMKLDGASRLVDVGGGRGDLLVAALQRHGALRGTLFDTPAYLDDSRIFIRDRGLAERCDLIAGNFFEAVPAGAGAYSIMRVLNNWDDERATSILRICARAMVHESRLFVVDPVAPPRAHFGNRVIAMDVGNMVNMSGKQRTLDELRALGEGAGLRFRRHSISRIYGLGVLEFERGASA